MDDQTPEIDSGRTAKPLKVIDGQRRGETIPPFARRPIRTANDARRMLSRLIHGFQLGQIDSADAKTLTYMLISYATILRDSDFEERLREIETKLAHKGGRK
jgi:hypothetical protein